MATRSALAELEGWWECPRRGCGVGGVHDANLGPIVNCYACGYQACFDCKVPWHRDFTCKQYHEELRYSSRRMGEKRREESKAAETVAKTTKACPGSRCAVRIEKNDGCQHMTCE